MSSLLAAAGVAVCVSVFLAAKPTSNRDVEVRSIQAQEIWMVGENGEKLGFWTPTGLAVKSPDSKQIIMLRVDRDKSQVSIELASPDVTTKILADGRGAGLAAGFGKLDKEVSGGGKAFFIATKDGGSGFIADPAGKVIWQTEK